jgi:hypothetical protein
MTGGGGGGGGAGGPTAAVSTLTALLAVGLRLLDRGLARGDPLPAAARAADAAAAAPMAATADGEGEGDRGAGLRLLPSPDSKGTVATVTAGPSPPGCGDGGGSSRALDAWPDCGADGADPGAPSTRSGVRAAPRPVGGEGSDAVTGTLSGGLDDVQQPCREARAHTYPAPPTLQPPSQRPLFPPTRA